MQESCWFCEIRPADGRAVIVKLRSPYKVVTSSTTGGGLSLSPKMRTEQREWKETSIDVPRCTFCAVAHQRHKTLREVLTIVMFLLIPLVVLISNWRRFDS